MNQVKMSYGKGYYGHLLISLLICHFQRAVKKQYHDQMVHSRVAQLTVHSRVAQLMVRSRVAHLMVPPKVTTCGDLGMAVAKRHHNRVRDKHS